MDVLEAITERRSVRKYRSEPVPDELILRCVEAARLAPSWANTQVSHFVVVKDRSVREALGSALSPNNPAYKAFADAPCVICLVAKRRVSGFKKGEPVTDKGDWYMYDAGISMEHLVLCACALGLGTVHVGNFDAKKVEEILGVPDGYGAVAMTPVGYFDEAPTSTPRRPLKDMLYLNRFGKGYDV
ncbi:MAG: nitroreductase family protein [Syntrophorhabdales bacterium]|jgi:nitroreductase